MGLLLGRKSCKRGVRSSAQSLADDIGWRRESLVENISWSSEKL